MKMQLRMLIPMWVLAGSGCVLAVIFLCTQMSSCIDNDVAKSNKAHEEHFTKYIVTGLRCAAGWTDKHDYERLNDKEFFCRKCGRKSR